MRRNFAATTTRIVIEDEQEDAAIARTPMSDPNLDPSSDMLVPLAP
jgi:hypothetical protein